MLKMTGAVVAGALVLAAFVPKRAAGGTAEEPAPAHDVRNATTTSAASASRMPAKSIVLFRFTALGSEWRR